MTVRVYEPVLYCNHTAKHRNLVFDNGELRDKPEAAAEVMASLMRPMEEILTCGDVPVSSEKRLAILKVHDSVWERIQEVRTPPLSNSRVILTSRRNCPKVCSDTLPNVVTR